ncbi:2-nitropropane dioxygenase [Variovorax sp. WS11]|uniref:NAD(P)H-dependent flavin oxidoreductase n=1 Tax=Variovorax sp. WS11 TaxID=1105204 RepID=UPI000D0DB8A4|nr:nitronate monooxygenase [Variovorax sp. WS11]NDZ17768.1 nitronate monooxygenase [Variovorax sp. WS11]PSL80212.1 2-nitropropane dioxygenase [Variovorax sp. WS11]
MQLPASISRRLKLPLIAAPMFRVSGPELIIAACRQGVIGSFPTANCRTIEDWDHWLTRIEESLTPADAPWCPNLIMRRKTVMEELDILLKHRVEMVITSVGSPEPVVKPLHDAGCLVFADVANVRHAEKAVAAGVDGLILLTAGAGGQTGWANGFSFVRAVRSIFDGPVVLAGGVGDGQAVWAAQTLGCDLAYMGTKFIATQESMADDGYKQMLVSCRLDDVLLTRAFTGLETNMLRPSIVAAGLDPDNLPTHISEERAAALYGGGTGSQGPKRWLDVWGAGHSVSGVTNIPSVAQLVSATAREYEQARSETARLLAWRPR